MTSERTLRPIARGGALVACGVAAAAPPVALHSSGTGPRTPSLIGNIQALRAFAAISVALYHVLITASQYSRGTILFADVEGWGARGVDVFFVVSGFVILHSHWKAPRSVPAFVRARLIRLVPAYWILTLSLVLAFLAAPEAFRHIDPRPGWVAASLGFVSLVACRETPVLFVGWTLELEALFYLVFAALIPVRSPKAMVALVLAALVVLAVAAERFLLLEFLLGMMVAVIVHAHPIPRTVGLAALVAGFAALWLLPLPDIQTQDWQRVIVWGIPALVLVLGAASSPQTRNQALMYLGAASYAVYLVQALAIPAFYKLVTMLPPYVGNDGLILLCLATAVAAGCLFHSFIEKPVGAWLRLRVP